MSKSLLNLGATLGRLGRLEESIAKIELAIEIIIEHEGDDSPLLATAYNTLGANYDGLGSASPNTGQLAALQVTSCSGASPSTAGTRSNAPCSSSASHPISQLAHQMPRATGA